MSFSSTPEDWVFNPVVMKELNDLFKAFMNNTHLNNPDLEDWECRVARAMQNQPPVEPPSWLGCHEIVNHLNKLYRHLHPSYFPNNSPDNVDDWECHVGDAMYDWAGMEKFFNLYDQPTHQPTHTLTHNTIHTNNNPYLTPPQSPQKRSRSPPSAPKKKVVKKRRTKH